MVTNQSLCNLARAWLQGSARVHPDGCQCSPCSTARSLLQLQADPEAINRQLTRKTLDRGPWKMPKVPLSTAGQKAWLQLRDRLASLGYKGVE